ncbi:hypothetical protein TI39_contig412g00048 [Zymoseptoria brevis]|uniref:Swi5-domain-containing protein n=1 Tax=Zymoseptoria brevis TaxID=1047168 RepID=A0A0F4GQI7_9PEZI|nr:hypothetical protein TI39_contig412g00048 [Zymoseptoria brevis]
MSSQELPQPAADPPPETKDEHNQESAADQQPILNGDDDQKEQGQMLPPPLPPSSSNLPSSDPASAPVPASDEADIPSSPSKPSSSEAKLKPPNPALLAAQATLASLQAERQSLVNSMPLPSGLQMPSEWSDEKKSEEAFKSANAIIKNHIDLLHRYNEIKDVGMGLAGLVAEKRGVRVKVLMEEVGLDEKD